MEKSPFESVDATSIPKEEDWESTRAEGSKVVEGDGAVEDGEAVVLPQELESRLRKKEVASARAKLAQEKDPLGLAKVVLREELSEMGKTEVDFLKVGRFEDLSASDKLEVVQEYKKLESENPDLSPDKKRAHLKAVLGKKLRESEETVSQQERGLDQEERIERSVKQESLEKPFVLDEVRKEFARSELALEREGLKGRRIEDVARAEEAARAEHPYRVAIRRERKNLASNLEQTSNRAEIAQEILLRTTALEATKLYDAKTEIKAKEQPPSLARAITKRMKGAERWYRNLRPRTKLLIAGGLFATGGAGAVAGGAVGACLVGGAVAGKTLQRAFAGAGVGVALEQAMKSSQESHEEKEILKAFSSEGGEKMLDLFANNNADLDNALLNIESKKSRRKVRRYLLAATGGGLMASGSAASAAEYVGGEASGLVDQIREKCGFGPAIAPDVEWRSMALDERATEVSDVRTLSTPEVETSIETEPYFVEPGDTLYAVLEKNFPEIAKLEGRARANAIENVLAIVEENPAEFGIVSGDLDALSIGDTIDIDKINEILATEKVNGQSILERAQEFVPEDSTAEVSEVKSDVLNEGGSSEQVVESSETAEASSSDVEGELSTEEVHAKLDKLFSTADVDIISAEAGGSGSVEWSSTEGTFNPVEHMRFQSAFQSFVEMVKSGEISAREFAQYVTEERGGDVRELARSYEYNFGLIKDPSSYKISAHEARAAYRSIQLVFQGLWVTKSQ